MSKFGLIVNYKWGKRHKIHKELQTITYKYGLIQGSLHKPKFTTVCFNSLQEAMLAQNRLSLITNVSECIYLITINDGRVISFEEVAK